MQANFMKYALLALLVLFRPGGATAQKNVFFADAGLSLARLLPGASLTYNYAPVKYVGIGAGIQGYDFHATRTNFQLIPTLFGEFRFNIRPQRNNQFYIFIDLGINFYRHNDDYWREDSIVYTVRNNNGSYTGVGFGKAWKMKKTDDARFYFSVKFISNSYYAHAYSLASGAVHNTGMGDATLVTSFGLKF